LSSPIDESYTLNWDFGDGEFGDAISPTHIFEEEGVYSIHLEIISPIGCKTEKSFPNWIEVEPKPVADFDFSPEQPNSFNMLVDFFDRSDGAISWFWNFSDEGTAFEPNPTHNFQDTGVHQVQLIVLHPSGCPDTIVKRIDIIPEVRYFLPNAFTPNNDAVNDVFKAKGIYDGLQEFSLTIWNRWGQRVFETEDPNVGWNGQFENTGQMSPNGVYVYLVRYIDPRGNTTESKGFASLIR
jgi:gliding motility-associated-like protein